MNVWRLIILSVVFFSQEVQWNSSGIVFNVWNIISGTGLMGLGTIGRKHDIDGMWFLCVRVTKIFSIRAR